jgi:hypothetical protein
MKVGMSALDQNEPVASTSTVNEKEAVGEQIDTEQMDIERAPELDVLAARQHTLLWDKEQCLDIAPGQNTQPMNIIYDMHAEELNQK